MNGFVHWKSRPLLKGQHRIGNHTGLWNQKELSSLAKLFHTPAVWCWTNPLSVFVSFFICYMGLDTPSSAPCCCKAQRWGFSWVTSVKHLPQCLCKLWINIRCYYSHHCHRYYAFILCQKAIRPSVEKPLLTIIGWEPEKNDTNLKGCGLVTLSNISWAGRGLMRPTVKGTSGGSEALDDRAPSIQ